MECPVTIPSEVQLLCRLPQALAQSAVQALSSLDSHRGSASQPQGLTRLLMHSTSSTGQTSVEDMMLDADADQRRLTKLIVDGVSSLPNPFQLRITPLLPTTRSDHKKDCSGQSHAGPCHMAACSPYQLPEPRMLPLGFYICWRLTTVDSQQMLAYNGIPHKSRGSSRHSCKMPLRLYNGMLL